MALSFSTKAKIKIAAVMMTALSAISGAFSVNAQDMAANTATTQQVSISPQCLTVKDIAAQTACEIQRRRDEHLAENAATTQAANAEGNCADVIKVGIQSGRFKPESLRDILDGRPAREVGACNILAKLQS